MPNAKDLVLEDANIRVLVYGKSGTGKTKFSSTFKKPFLFDFDQGHLTLMGQDVEYEVFEVNSPDPMRGPKQEYARFIQVMNSVLKKVKSGEIETIILDSITTYSELLINKIMADAGKLGQNPEIQNWGTQVNLLVQTINQLKGFPCNLVIIAHEHMDKDEMSGAIYGGPLITGKLSSKLGLYFDEVYRAVIGGTPQKPEYLLRTKAEGRWESKSRIDGVLKNMGHEGLPVLMQPDYQTILDPVSPVFQKQKEEADSAKAQPVKPQQSVVKPTQSVVKK